VAWNNDPVSDVPGEALYLRDPDGNGVELYWDRPQAQWPRNPDGTLAMGRERLDLEALLAEAKAG
jgi:catechol 2,3-dioxygenase